MHRNHLILAQIIAITVFLQDGTATEQASAIGESFEVKLLTPELAPCEPLIVEVTLHSHIAMPDPQSTEDPRVATLEGLRYLHRRLEGILQRESSDVCTFPLYGPDLAPVDAQPTQYRGTYFALISQLPDGGSRRTYYTEPGEYVLLIRDKENRALSPSRAVPLKIRPTLPGELEALRQVQTVEPDELLQMLLSPQKANPDVAKTFRQLTRQHSQTVFGRYATASIALYDYARIREKHNNEGGAPVWQPVVMQLRQASDALTLKRHPLRETILLRLACAQALSESFADARRSMQKLNEEFPESPHRALMEQLEKEIAEMDRNRTGTQTAP